MNRSRIFFGIAIIVGIGAIASVLLGQSQKACGCKPANQPPVQRLQSPKP